MPDQKKTRRQLLEEFIAKSPEDTFSRYGLALECSNTGDVAAADAHFRALNERNPEYIPAYLMYAQMLARESRPAAQSIQQTLGFCNRWSRNHIVAV